jgi:hypothetical protein
MSDDRRHSAEGVGKVHFIDGLLTVIAVVSVLVAGARLSAGQVEATHLTWDQRHLGSMHTAYVDEDFCTESSNTDRSWVTAQQNISNALWVEQSDPNQEWDAKGWDSAAQRYRVWFWAHWNNPCQLLPAEERDPITIEYWLWNNNSGNCGSVKCSIAIGASPYIDQMGHEAKRFYYIHLYAPYTVGEEITGYYRHQVNHETGHAMGLDDGGGSPCPDSVMHTTFYGCSQDRSYPSSGDTSSETTRIFN